MQRRNRRAGINRGGKRPASGRGMSATAGRPAGFNYEVTCSEAGDNLAGDE